MSTDQILQIIQLVAPIFGPILLGIFRKLLGDVLPKAALPIIGSGLSGLGAGLLGPPKDLAVDPNQWTAFAAGSAVLMRELGDQGLKLLRAKLAGDPAPR